MPSYRYSSSDFLQSQHTVHLTNFLLPFSCTSWCCCSLPCISKILQVQMFSFSVLSFCRTNRDFLQWPFAWKESASLKNTQDSEISQCVGNLPSYDRREMCTSHHHEQWRYRHGFNDHHSFNTAVTGTASAILGKHRRNKNLIGQSCTDLAVSSFTVKGPSSRLPSRWPPLINTRDKLDTNSARQVRLFLAIYCLWNPVYSPLEFLGIF